MRSFRLDAESVETLVESWPLILVSAVAGVGLSVFARDSPWGQLLIPLLYGVALGPSLLSGQLRRQYPTARHLWLLAIGMTTSGVGLVGRMTFPAWQGTAFDLTWLGISFFSILTFVLVNRRNKDVVQ